ncbi:DUF4169 family protein [Rhodobacteraceae bacterium D3-12]|nr:DUF4169 family protein [Rhodobacteraceae bacterium D3-12]
MAEIVNLNKARKARSRRKTKAQADENAVKFGRTKAQKSLEKSRADKADRDHDQTRRED